MDVEEYLKQNGVIDQMVNLIIGYIGDYNQQEHPFLLFDLANVNENDHTKVLLGILKYNNYQFLPSFLQAIGAPEFYELEEIPTDQKKAIGDKGDGFIDLFFQYRSKNGEQEKIIIENKIYGAGDTNYQLARYIATAIDSKISNERFKEIWERWKNGDDADVKWNFDHIHVVYLTSDGEKKPEEISLPKYFRKDDKEGGVFEVKHINYYPINYIENIIPWLENDVLPNMPYSDAGIAIAGVRQYLAFLKTMFSSKGNSEIINKYFEKIKTDKGKYDEILSVMDVIKTLKDNKRKRSQKNNEGTDSLENLKKCLEDERIDVDDLALQPLLRDLRAAATSIFSNDGSDLDGDWKLYFTPSFIFLYRQRWADLDTRKYSIPSIYFQTSTYNFLKKEGRDIRWKIQVDHLDDKTRDRKIKADTFRLGNHGKTAYYEIKDKNLYEDLSFKLDSPDSRKVYYNLLLGKMSKYISIVDGVVNGIWDKLNDDEIFQEYALREIAKTIVEEGRL